MVKNFIKKVKNKENYFFYFCSKVIYGIFTIKMPVNKITRPIFKCLYIMHGFFIESSRVVLNFFYSEPLFRARCEKVGKNLRMEKLPYIEGQGKIVIGNNVRLSFKPNFLVGTHIFEESLLEIGDNTFIGSGVVISVAKHVKIGNNCLIAGGVRIFDNDNHPIDADKRRRNFPVEKSEVKPVIIKDNVWIGANATILKGVVIGDRSIIGTCAVVSKSVPDDCIVAGNPASIVKRLN